MTFFFFLRQREERPQREGEVLFDVGDEDVLKRRLALDAVDQRIKTAEHDERLRAAVLELIGRLARRIEWVYRDSDGANFERGDIADHELRAVGHEERDAIALTDAALLEGHSEAI